MMYLWRQSGCLRRGSHRVLESFSRATQMSCDISCKTTIVIVISITTSIIKGSTSVQDSASHQHCVSQCSHLNLLAIPFSWVALWVRPLDSTYWNLSRISFLHMSCDIWRRGRRLAIPLKGRGVLKPWHGTCYTSGGGGWAAWIGGASPCPHFCRSKGTCVSNNSLTYLMGLVKKKIF